MRSAEIFYDAILAGKLEETDEGGLHIYVHR